MHDIIGVDIIDGGEGLTEKFISFCLVDQSMFVLVAE